MMQKNILVIEDNNETRECLVELLAMEGFGVKSAEGGAKAFAILVNHTPDLIICDINMPEVDGFEVFRRLQAYENTRIIPFMFSTTKSESKDIQKAKDLGISNYLIKPFDGVELMNSINAALQKR